MEDEWLPAFKLSRQVNGLFGVFLSKFGPGPNLDNSYPYCQIGILPLDRLQKSGIIAQ